MLTLFACVQLECFIGCVCNNNNIILCALGFADYSIIGILHSVAMYTRIKAI